MDLRKKPSALDPLQSALDKLKSSQQNSVMSALKKIEDEANPVERYLSKPAGMISLHRDRELLDKLSKSTLGAGNPIDELLKANGNMPGWASGVHDTSFLRTAQAIADSEALLNKGSIAEFSIANGLTDALKTLDTA